MYKFKYKKVEVQLAEIKGLEKSAKIRGRPSNNPQG